MADRKGSAKQEKSETGNSAKCKKQSSKQNYSRKRRKRGANQYTKYKATNDAQVVDVPEKTRRKSVVTEEDKMVSVSAKKVKKVPLKKPEVIQFYFN